MNPERGAAPAREDRLYGITLQAEENLWIAGVLCWCLHSYPTKETRFPTPRESMSGLVRHDGSLKPAALRLRDTFRK